MLKIETDKSLKDYNTFRINAVSAYFLSISEEADIHNLRSSEVFNKNKIFILGGGANVLFVNNYDGLVLHSDIKDIKIIEETDDYAIVQAGSGADWDELVNFALQHGLCGMENLVCIPGSVGAAPVQNVGAYGREQQDFFYSLDAVNLLTGEKIELFKNDCKFGYRGSVFKLSENKNKYFITYVRYKLSKQENLNFEYKDIKEAMNSKGIQSIQAMQLAEIIAEIRRCKLPDTNELGSAGSFFKNPLITSAHLSELKKAYPDLPAYPAGENFKIPAAYLIEKAGLKGYRQGDAGIYNEHSLIIVNYGNASGRDIYELSEKVINVVYNKYNIQLEPEAVFVF